MTALEYQRAIAHRIAVEESGDGAPDTDPDTELEDETDDRP